MKMNEDFLTIVTIEVRPVVLSAKCPSVVFLMKYFFLHSAKFHLQKIVGSNLLGHDPTFCPILSSRHSIHEYVIGPSNKWGIVPYYGTEKYWMVIMTFSKFNFKKWHSLTLRMHPITSHPTHTSWQWDNQQSESVCIQTDSQSKQQLYSRPSYRDPAFRHPDCSQIALVRPWGQLQ